MWGERCLMDFYLTRLHNNISDGQKPDVGKFIAGNPGGENFT